MDDPVVADLLRRAAALCSPLFALLVGVDRSPQAAHRHRPPPSFRRPASAHVAAGRPALARRPAPRPSSAQPGPPAPRCGQEPGSVPVDLDRTAAASRARRVVIILLLTRALGRAGAAADAAPASPQHRRRALADPQRARACRRSRPNQVLAGLALFLSLFIMAPTLTQDERRGAAALPQGRDRPSRRRYDDGVEPLREFMLKQTRKDELDAVHPTRAARRSPPKPRGRRADRR